ncbi:DKNYY domain-containing protein [Acinetobacter larvae]|uniref:DKNYY family protein n=1 Tax=Acinetobacter larvae TaxID=1789224 RepID=A0A1B2M154_9GAMM|nr:DKNYY domain-containing protein [Acinetobacter larvae]AOA58932.1 hypothetical protein BFG52_11600 [Acinetobacter larvae]
MCFILVAKLSNSHDHSTNQQKLGIFHIEGQKVYANIAHGGTYWIQQADAHSFHLISDRIKYRQLAADRQHVYCGQQILAGLNVQQLKIIAHGYITDGQSTWYCAPQSQEIASLSTIQQTLQSLRYFLNLGTPPVTHDYPAFKLPASKQHYHALLDTDLLTDGTAVYYRGQVLPYANPHTLRQIPQKYADGTYRPSPVYLADGQRVYYQNTVLDLKDNPDIYVLVIDQSHQENYLFEPHTGQVYVRDLAFEQKYRPYRVISQYGAHIQHTLFLSPSGIFYFDAEKRKIIALRDNPFLNGNFKEIAPLVYADGQQVLYLETKNAYQGHKRTMAKAYFSVLYRLNDAQTAAWQQLKQYDNHYSLWQHGEHFYYFDQLGSSQLIQKTIYRIKDLESLHMLQHARLSPQQIRQLIKQDKLVEPQRTALLTVKSKVVYRDQKMIWFMIITILVLSFILFLVQRYRIYRQSSPAT